jgi:hypothetical protein
MQIRQHGGEVNPTVATSVGCIAESPMSTLGLILISTWAVDIAISVVLPTKDVSSFSPLQVIPDGRWEFKHAYLGFI